MIEFDLSGDDELRRVIRELPDAIAREVAMDALVEAGQPTIEMARANAPVETGSLRDSIGGVLRKYLRGLKLIFIIGARRGFGKDGREPANYAHLVEYGHAAVKPLEGTSLRHGTAQATALDKKDFVEGKPFLRPAWEATKAQVIETFRARFGEGLMAAVKRRVERRARSEARIMAQWDKLQEAA